jgi:hypothetical protein
MIANMSSDRIMAVRVFEGELERMKVLCAFPESISYTQEQKIIRRYLQERINEMTSKGHHWK